MSETFDKRLETYSRLAVKAGLNVQPGQEVFVVADVIEAPLARLVAAEAYRAGAINVMLSYTDDAATLLRYKNASSESLAYAPGWFYNMYAERVHQGAAYIRVFGSDPSLLSGVPSDKLAIACKAQAEAGKPLSDALQSGKGSWSIVACASPAWAMAVFPNDSPEVAVKKLWDAIFSCCHLDEEEPLESWNAHMNGLEARLKSLNARHFAALHFKGPGTDLRVGLADGYRWLGGRMNGPSAAFCPNIPTEEVFTMPHRSRVDGIVSSTKPLSVRGSIVDGIQLTFEGGVATNVKAAVGESVFKDLLDTDAGARRLGEVALVPNSSRVSRSNLLYFNTLFDENAACHIAMGRAIPENLSDAAELSDAEREQRGMNESLIHVDWMIGSGAIDVDGVGQDGTLEPLMRAGEWVD